MKINLMKYSQVIGYQKISMSSYCNIYLAKKKKEKENCGKGRRNLHIRAIVVMALYLKLVSVPSSSSSSFHLVSLFKPFIFLSQFFFSICFCWWVLGGSQKFLLPDR